MALRSTQLFDICFRQFKSQIQLPCHLRRAEHLRFSAAASKEWKTLHKVSWNISNCTRDPEGRDKTTEPPTWTLHHYCRLFQGTPDSFSIQNLSLHSPGEWGTEGDQQTVVWTKFQKGQKERQISFHVNSSMMAKVTSFFPGAFSVLSVQPFQSMALY